MPRADRDDHARCEVCSGEHHVDGLFITRRGYCSGPGVMHCGSQYCRARAVVAVKMEWATQPLWRAPRIRVIDNPDGSIEARIRHYVDAPRFLGVSLDA